MRQNPSLQPIQRVLHEQGDKSRTISHKITIMAVVSRKPMKPPDGQGFIEDVQLWKSIEDLVQQLAKFSDFGERGRAGELSEQRRPVT